MRKYGKWLLVMAVLAAVPAVASAEGYLDAMSRQRTQSTGAAAKHRNQQQAEQVKAALQEARIDGYGIKIEAVDGVVKLSGNVRDASHRAKAGDVCRRLPGVTRVQNELRFAPANEVRPAAATLLDLALRGRKQKQQDPAVRQVKSESQAPSNQQIAENIGGSLKSAGLAGMPIDIRFQNGTVTLSGNVPSAAQRQAAEAAASRVEGVNSVNNQLEIPPAPAPQRFPQIPPQAPQQLAQAPQQFAQAPPQFAQASQPMNQAPQQFFTRPMIPAAEGQQFTPAGYPQGGPPMPPSSPGMQQVSASGPAAIAGAGVFSHPHMPTHAWPAYAQYPNSAAVTYPTQYSASAFPYIGPFYPYPQVPLGWREARLQWDDGFWSLNFNKQQDVWHVLFHPWEKD